jgi:hypothetical protein
MQRVNLESSSSSAESRIAPRDVELERASLWRRAVATCGATHRLTRGQFARKLVWSVYLRKRQESAACIPGAESNCRHADFQSPYRLRSGSRSEIFQRPLNFSRILPMDRLTSEPKRCAERRAGEAQVLQASRTAFIERELPVHQQQVTPAECISDPE